MQISDTFILLSRSILDSAVFASDKMLKIWIWCLCKANYKDKIVPIKTGRGFTTVELKRGEFLFGRFSAEEELFINGSTIYKIMQKLQNIGNISIKSNSHYSIVSICNYNTYQNPLNYKVTPKEQASNRQVTGKEQPSNRQVTQLNKDNKDNKDNIYIHPLQIFVKENMPTVSKLKIQLTEQNCIDLLNQFSKNLIKDKLAAMENKKDLLNKYKSVYLTLLGWCKKDNEEQKTYKSSSSIV